MGFELIRGQGFVNLDFENTTVTPVVFGGTRYVATIPGWSWDPSNFLDGGTNNVVLDDIALDAPAVTLQDWMSPFFPAIDGNYSVYLQGGSVEGGIQEGTNGASIFQTGQVPSYAKSLIYLGGSLQVQFNGQVLTPVVLSYDGSYAVWGVDISAYAGQSGELRFTKPWLNTSYSAGAILDDIQFSPTPVPEPSALALCGVSALCLFGIHGLTIRRSRRRSCFQSRIRG